MTNLHSGQAPAKLSVIGNSIRAHRPNIIEPTRFPESHQKAFEAQCAVKKFKQLIRHRNRVLTAHLPFEAPTSRARVSQCLGCGMHRPARIFVA